jgi:hypothetical protein
MLFSLVIAVFVLFVWAIDFVTLQGERTIYTTQCRGGNWVDDRCTGNLAAAQRYRFRALKPKNEVVFWIVGSAEPSGKLTQCTIQDGRNWSCTPGADASKSITLQMKRGEAVHDVLGNTPPFHAVPKWKWFLLRFGSPTGDASATGR